MPVAHESLSDWVSVAPGVRLHTREWGNQTLSTCVLIHGIAEGSFVWEEFIFSLLDRYRIIAIDLRGHGESDRAPAGQYDFESFVGDVETLFKKMGLGKIVLVGHSLGAGIAAQIAPSLGEALEALVIVDGGPNIGAAVRDIFRSQLYECCRPYNEVDEYFDWLREHRVLAPVEALRRLAANSLRRRDDGSYQLKYDPAVLDLIGAMNDDGWWWPALRRTSAPTLIIRGIGSAMLLGHVADKMARTAPRGELAVIPGAGHAVMIDNAADFSSAVESFLSKVSSARDRRVSAR